MHPNLQALQKAMKRVLITGATGNMGFATLKEFMNRTDRFKAVVLARDSKKNRKLLAPYMDRIDVVWGDLNRFEDVHRATTGVDYVLHIGGMVSPAADYYPNRTRTVNVTAARNIASAVMSQPNHDEIKVCYIGSVSQTSDRNEPLHWGRTGDPIMISVYDHYAISKTIAERVIVESGIKNWVALRQSGILYPGILKNFDPIMFHVPLRGVLEWATVEDSARCMANLCEENVPDEFWCRFYNIGSGAEYRLSNYEFEKLLLGAIHAPAPEKCFNPEWFVLRNFHGQWYEDSQVLEDYLHFRANTPVKEYFKQMSCQIPWFYQLAALCPPFVFKMVLKPLANKKKWGTQYWIKNNDEDRIRAYYGSKEAWAAIKPWKEQDLSHPSETPVHLDHGYDESKPREEWTIEDMRQAAAFRGGKCLSETMVKGDFRTPLEWECQFGHRFKASPVLILQGGHWCPECLPAPWHYTEIAKGNPFIAQVWNTLHPGEEPYTHDEALLQGWEGDSKKPFEK